jgi:hypothetical protein
LPLGQRVYSAASVLRLQRVLLEGFKRRPIALGIDIDVER